MSTNISNPFYVNLETVQIRLKFVKLYKLLIRKHDKLVKGSFLGAKGINVEKCITDLREVIGLKFKYLICFYLLQKKLKHPLDTQLRSHQEEPALGGFPREGSSSHRHSRCKRTEIKFCLENIYTTRLLRLFRRLLFLAY